MAAGASGLILATAYSCSNTTLSSCDSSPPSNALKNVKTELKDKLVESGDPMTNIIY